MTYRLQYLEGSEEPVSISEVLIACRLEDALTPYLSTAIAAARQEAEQVTGRQYRGQRLRHELEDWPADVLAVPVHRADSVSIEYRSAEAPEAWTTLSTSIYRWSPVGNKTQVRLAAGQAWPALATEDWGIRVRLTLDAGPTDMNAVPECVRLYILASVSSWADNPTGLIAGNLQPNPMHARLLDGERLWG